MFYAMYAIVHVHIQMYRVYIVYYIYMYTVCVCMSLRTFVSLDSPYDHLLNCVSVPELIVNIQSKTPAKIREI